MLYPERSNRFRTNFSGLAAQGSKPPLATTMPLQSPPADAPMFVSPSQGAGYGDDSTNRYAQGTSPLPNQPGVRTYPLLAEPYQAEVLEDVGATGTTVVATLVDDGTTVTATLLMPYDAVGMAQYNPEDCVPQYVMGDMIMVFRTRDTDEWIAPGPFIPKEVIKAIFTCPA